MAITMTIEAVTMTTEQFSEFYGPGSNNRLVSGLILFVANLI